MDKFFKKLKQPFDKLFGKFENNHLIGLLGLIFVVLVVSQYSGKKGLTLDKFSEFGTEEAKEQGKKVETEIQDASQVQAANPVGENEVYSQVSGIGSPAAGLPPSCTRQPVADPSELLPKDQNNEWAKLNPTGSGDLNNVNLLKAGYHVGIDTIGNSLRNANLQVRSEPPNPQLNVGPWNNTTIAPDYMRAPLEIGCGPQ
jgi:hypothetical protein